MPPEVARLLRLARLRLGLLLVEVGGRIAEVDTDPNPALGQAAPVPQAVVSSVGRAMVVNSRRVSRREPPPPLPPPLIGSAQDRIMKANARRAAEG